ncbi:hypothetical protein [Mesobacillus zeae]|uniref:Uncharacterized protein n=1 Tax=Mesobacillus zeae TaxID=1917180 RepID=A0A398BAX7_9BACI|nr:hypothetical protein [Mesobacillus zeae]RID85010.1 hypothetical protein D1970_10610 [Mesobacillus zeae]
MKITYQFYDEKGNWLPGEEITLENDEQPESGYFTDKPLPQPCWKPIFDKVKNDWVETATEEEKNPPQPVPEPSQLEKQVALIQAALDDLILAGSGV